MIDKYIKLFGADGFPKCLDPSLVPTWEVHNFREIKTPRDRVMSVLGFLYLLHQSGMRDKISTNVNVPAVYNEILLDDLTDHATDLAKQLMKYRLLDVLRIYKSRVKVMRDLRNSGYTLRLDVCFEPKRKESMDMALSKLEGLFYRGDLPDPLKERWKKLPVNSKAKAKSDLFNHSELMASDSVLGRLPMYAYKNSSIYAARAAGDLLTLRFLLRMPYDGTPWLTPLRRDRNLKTLFTKAFSKIAS